VTRRLRDGQVFGCLALLSAPLPWTTCCWAGEPAGAVPSLNGPEIMLYISQPIGPSAPARSYGLRIDQHSLPRALPAATANATDLSGRREIVNLSMVAHENLRIDFGRRVGWDFGRGQFKLPSDLPAMKPRFPTRSLAAAFAPATASFAARKTVAELPALP
jgi:hypothetical protein